MSHRKLQKEVDTIFKKINEGIDLFNYYYTRHETSTNDSQRDKLESDLKKEIKKLQKFRDQIKTWQLNDSIEAAIVPARLQEHRRLVEEAMERYKDVEKLSKMKSFSNQSIMLAALEQDENRNLTQEGVECIEFLETSIEELNEQNENLESEYEKLNQKKTSKKNSSQFDERKQEIDAFSNRNKFHIEKLEHCIQFLRRGRIPADLVSAIRDDISFYIESNQEPDFVDDETLYDEIIKEAKKQKEAQDLQTERELQLESVLNEDLTQVSSSNNPANPASTSVPASSSSASNSLSSSPHKAHLNNSNNNNNIHNGNNTSNDSINISTPILSAQTVPHSPEFITPAIIKTLKPATTPTKPVGALKWATAAAGKEDKPLEQLQHTKPSQLPQQLLHQQQAQELVALLQQQHSDHQPLENGALNGHAKRTSSIPSTSKSNITHSSNDNSNSIRLFGKDYNVSDIVEPLSKVERELFSDTNLIKLPPGIQDLLVSFTATRNTSFEEGNHTNYLIHPSANSSSNPVYNPYKSPLQRPFLPTLPRSSFFPHLMPDDFVRKPSQQSLKPPPNLLKLQLYWNNIRTQLDNFDLYVQKLQQLTQQATPELLALVSELTSVFFYGYYYGFLPMENFIAEQCLFQLGWKPYRTKEQSTEQVTADREYYHWFKAIKIHATAAQLAAQQGVAVGAGGAGSEIGDYQVFDLLAWETYVKSNFKFDFNLSQSEPSTVL